MSRHSRRPLVMKTPFLSLLVLASIAGCASHPKLQKRVEVSEADLADSAVEINYALSQSQYHLSLKAQAGKAEIVNQVNERTVKRRSIEPARYLDFANKVSRVAADLRAAQGNAPAECKTPFVLSVNKAGTPVQRVAGCRSEDQSGQIGRLIQEGELLLLGTEIESRIE